MKTKFIFIFTFILASFCLSCKKDQNDPLRASFSSDSNSVVAGGSVIFSDQSTGNPSRWKWTFEGGKPATSNLSSPTVIFELPGTYGVTLEVSNESGTDVIKEEAFITVSYDQILVDFEADKLSAMQGEPVVFKDLSTGLPSSWHWEFINESGTIVTSIEQNPTITFSEFGKYTVKLTASNPEHSSTKIKEKHLTILDATSVEANFSSNETATFTGGSISFTDQSVGNASAYSWSFEGGRPSTSKEKNPIITYDKAGRYKVKLIASNPFKSSTVEKEGYIIVVPANDLSAFFPFNGNIKDVGPLKLTSKVIGNIDFLGPDRKLQANNTAIFNGSSVLVVPNHEALNFGIEDFSVAAWVKTNQSRKMFIWMESGKQGSKDNQAWSRIGNNTTTQLLQFATEDAAGGTFVSVGTPGKVSDNKWHHIVCVREGRVTRVYLNGSLIQEATAPAVRNVSNDADFKIGAQEGLTGFSSYFQGQLDDVVIYKKALTLSEVQALYNL